MCRAKYISLFLFHWIFSSACSAGQQTTLVFQYDDFGPQSAADKILGRQWWQWQSHGDSRPRKYDIKVVVYKGISLQEVKRLYPVLPEKKQDFRYVEYQLALDYLDKNITENVMQILTEKLQVTKNRLTQAFNTN